MGVVLSTLSHFTAVTICVKQGAMAGVSTM